MAPEPIQPIVTGKKRLSRRKDGPAFEFVTNAIATQHGDARAAIRRQAARSGRRARLRETRGAETSMLLEPEDPSSVQESVDTPQGPQRQHVPVVRLERPVLAAGAVTQPSFSGYEAIRAIYNFDITALESFTNVDFAVVGYRLMMQACLERPGALLCNQVSSSFLAHLPARYGYVPFLDDAIQCVAARAAQMLGRSATSSSASALYGKALRSLCSSVQSSSWSDVYCATRLFVLYEVNIILYT